MSMENLQKLMYGESLPDIFVLFGQPVIGNPTQYMFEMALQDCHLDGRYLSIEVSPSDLEDAVIGMRAMKFKGAHITIPHKVAVLRFLDELTEAAKLIGAVNCIIEEDGKLIGENTDGKGFIQSLGSIMDPKGKKVVILGSGGAARAIAVELVLSGVNSITIVNRTKSRGLALSDYLNSELEACSKFIGWDDIYQPHENTDILINATSLGLNKPDQIIPIDFSKLNKNALIADVVFNPQHTYFLKEATKHGFFTLDGLGMLVNQGFIAFNLWTGESPDRDVMMCAIKEALSV